MRSSPLAQLLEIQWQVMQARWRDAARRKHGVPALLAGALSSLVTGVLLLGAATAFGIVGTVLLGALAGAGKLALGASVAGALGEIACILTVLTALLSDAQRTGLDRQPLAMLPLKTSDLLAADLVSILFLQPTAFVIWPTTLALVLGPAQHSPRAAALALPAATGALVLSSTLALLLRRLTTPLRPGDPPPFLARPAGRLLAMVVPVAWLIVVLGPFDALGERTAPLLTPGHWIERSILAAWNGEARAVVFGLVLHLVGFGVFSLAATLPKLRWPRLPLDLPLRGWLPVGLAQIWHLPRARALMVQGVGIAGLTLILAAVLERRGVRGIPLVPIAGLLVAWLIATGPAALMSNALGLGGRAAASLGLLPISAGRLLLQLQGSILLLPLLALAALPLVFGLVFSAGGTGLAAAMTGAGCLLSGAGAGCLLSVWWPWPARLAAPGDPVWPPGAARLVMPLAQGGALAPSILFLSSSDQALAWAGSSGSLLIGCVVAAAGWHLATNRLDRHPVAITESLLE